MAETRVLYLRLPVEVHERVEQMAEETSLSMTVSAQLLLTDALDRRDARKGSGPLRTMRNNNRGERFRD